LAGSENVARSGASGGRAREAGSINQSLLTLGRVITCLVERTPHIPYRESKLTRLLQDSLGGKTKTSIIATISPAFTNIEETLSTLDYAQRAKNITNRPELNQKLSKNAVLKEYNEEIERLRQNLFRTREGEGVYLAHENYQEMIERIQVQENEIKEMIGEMRALKQEMDLKVDLFEQSELQLQENKKLLENKQAVLVSAETKLSESRKELQDTAKQRDIQAHLVEKRQQTEFELCQQARKLLVVCDEVASDTDEIHHKIGRVKKVQQENEEVQMQFGQMFSTKIATLDDAVKGYQTECHEKSEELKKMISRGFADYANSLSTLSNMITAKQQKNSESMNIVLMENDSQQRTACDEYARETLENLDQVKDTCQQFENAANDTFLQCFLSQLLAERDKTMAFEKLANVCCDQVLQQFSSTTQKMIDYLNQLQMEVVKNVEEDAGLLQEMAQVIHKTNTSMHKFSTGLDLLLQAYNEHNTLMHTNRAETENIASQVTSSSSDSQRSAVSIHQTEFAQLHSETLQQLDFDAASTVTTMRDSLSECKNYSDQQVKLRSTFQELKNTQVQITTNTISQLKQQSQHFSQDRRSDNELIISKLSAQQTTSLDDFIEDKENVEQQLVASKTRMRTSVDQAVSNIDKLQYQCNAFQTKLSDNLKSVEDEVIELVNSSLKQDISTGRTPVPTCRSYPRTLSATSPHAKIIERFELNYTVPDLELPVNDLDGDSAISRSTRTSDSMTSSIASRAGRESQTSDLGTINSMGGSFSADVTDIDEQYFKVPKAAFKKMNNQSKMRSQSEDLLADENH